MTQKAEEVDVTIKKHEFEIGIKDIMNALLSNSSNVISGLCAMEIMSCESKYDPEHHAFEIHVFTKDFKATRTQCKMFHHISQDVSATWKDDDDICIVKIFLKDEHLCVYIRNFNEKDNFYASLADGYATSYAEMSKFGMRIKDQNGAFSSMNQSNLFLYILYFYEKGYIPIVAPLVKSTMQKRIASYARVFSDGKGWTPIRMENSDNEFEATIGTTLEAIEKFHPDIYENHVKDNICPISQKPFSEMEGKMVILTNTKCVYEKEGFLNYINQKDFNSKCPYTKLDLK